MRKNSTFTFNISSEKNFNNALKAIDVGGKDAGTGNTYTFNLKQGILLSQQLYAVNLTDKTSKLIINGGGHGLIGAGAYNGLFVYRGTVDVNNLLFSYDVARGGSGAAGHGGGGGGAGLGGGLFVASGAAVTLTNDTFIGDGARGGAGGQTFASVGGGGGGLEGGNGALGGGGVGLGASGGGSLKLNGGTGIIPGGRSGGSGIGNSDHGGNSGGGGGGVEGANSGNSGGGGGGGVNGGGGGSGGGNGGFGGGGGTFSGDGGFGGGGAATGGRGGFGGGGGGGSGGGGGFGGGDGGSFSRFGNDVNIGGGGGLAAGGDIFVQQGGALTIASGSLAAATVTGGASGGAGSSAGAGLGSGLFIQGNQTVTLDPGAGQSLSIAGAIADESGSTLAAGQGTGSGAGALAVESGTVTLTGTNTYTGGTTISGGTLVDAATSGSGIGSGGVTIYGGTLDEAGSGLGLAGGVTFAGTQASPATLVMSAAAQSTANGTDVGNFGISDTIDLQGLTFSSAPGNGVSYDATTGQLRVTEGNRTEIFVLFAPSSTSFFAADDGSGGTEIFGPPSATGPVCFAGGTRIATLRGDVAVEDLAVGDLVATTSGAHRPIRWLGHRTIDCPRHPRPHEARPIEIAAHAFGEGRPARDLRVSPGHSICVDVVGEVLIPAASLVNGATIRQVEVDEVTYWHVELDSHDILLAENLPAESYLDMGNRGFFHEADVVDLAAGPDADPALRTHADFCRPFHDAGALVEVVKAQLAARAEAMGWSLTTALELHLEVDGRRLEPVVRGATVRFHVPAGARELWLVAPTARPRDTMAATGDSRDLGLSLAALRIDDGVTAPRDVALDDPLLCVGFHAAEDGRRWTAGRALLPAALWDGCEGGFFLRLQLAAGPVPRWERMLLAEPVRLAVTG